MSQLNRITFPRRAVGRSLSWAQREAIGGYLFAAPTIVGYVLFVLGPIVAAMFISCMEWNILTPPKWIGLLNYDRLIADRRVTVVLGNSLKLAVSLIVLDVVVGLGLALLVNSRKEALLRYLSRTSFFFPVLISGAVVSVIWFYFLHYDFGVINYYLRKLGIPRIPWLISHVWAIPSVLLVSLWKGVGFSFVILLAGLQNIPPHLYEAASIDGAGPVARFRYVTLPMLTPTLFFLAVVGAIGGLQVFDIPTVLTQGGPGDASRTIVMYIYYHGFQSLRLGYASALAMILFALILLLTAVQLRLSPRWVFYQ
jgi:multiple sugar transport system permease protein